MLSVDKAPTFSVIISANAEWEAVKSASSYPCIEHSPYGDYFKTIVGDALTLFFHGGWDHILGNMLYLYLFGDNVEDRLGKIGFWILYFVSGFAATFAQVLIDPTSQIPLIGASGAIFGLMGAYLLLYPGGRIRTLVFISFVPLWPRIRAIWIVLYFVGIHIIPAIQILLRKADYSINHWAHLGGFFSSVFILLFLRPEAFARYLSDTSV